MTRILLILIALFLLTVLAWYCIRMESADIEADLGHRSLAALGYAGFDKLDITVDGQDITVNGTVDSDDQRHQALASVSNVWGINRIHDNLIQTGNATATSTAPATAAPPQVTGIAADGDATTISLPPPGHCDQSLRALTKKEKLRFTLGSEELTERSLPLLRDIAKLLRACPNRVLTISGHTDSIGSANNNLALSQARAEAVAQALSRFGISADRLLAVGKGESEPIADNGTAAGREANRRITFEFQPKSDATPGRQ